jgi:hypothetical protein
MTDLLIALIISGKQHDGETDLRVFSKFLNDRPAFIRLLVQNHWFKSEVCHQASGCVFEFTIVTVNDEDFSRRFVFDIRSSRGAPTVE